jgi:hypothetical protein
MPPLNDLPANPDIDSSASLETDAQKNDTVSEEIASAAETLDDQNPSLDSTANKNIFNTIQELSPQDSEKKTNKFIGRLKHLDRYILIFIFIVLIVLLVVFYIFQKKATPTITAKSTGLSQSTLTQLNSNSVVVGGTQETLDIQSNSVFSGNALVKGGLQVAGAFVAAGSTSLENVTIYGNTQFNQISGNNLTITGTSNLKGQVIVGQSLSVSGTSNLSGAVNVGKLTVGTLQVNGDINIDYHLVTNGVSPTIKPMSSAILGSGGTVSINGSDTSGTVAINFGTSGAAGCDVTISYSQPFSKIPSVIISPTSSGAANINYYVTNKSDNGFEICSSGASNTTANFDYFVID